MQFLCAAGIEATYTALPVSCVEDMPATYAADWEGPPMRMTPLSPADQIEPAPGAAALLQSGKLTGQERT